MNSELYITEHYKSEKIADFKEMGNLSLFIDNQLFMFCIFNEDYTAIKELCHIKINSPVKANNLSEEIHFLINSYRLTQSNFKHVNICVLNHYFTLTPEAFSFSEGVKSVLQFTGGVNTNLKNSFIHKLDQVNFCYSIPDSLIQLLERSFTNAAIRHAGGVLCELLFSNASLKNCDLLLNFNKGVFELAAKENNLLIYYNVFNYENNEDVLYYLLFMMEQYKLNPLTCRLMVSGQININDELFKAFKKYVKQVNFAVNNKSFSAAFSELNLPDHFFFSLVNQHLCV